MSPVRLAGRTAHLRAGFVEEGTTRQDARVGGRSVDEAVTDVLAEQWRAAQRAPE